VCASLLSAFKVIYKSNAIGSHYTNRFDHFTSSLPLQVLHFFWTPDRFLHLFHRFLLCQLQTNLLDERQTFFSYERQKKTSDISSGFHKQTPLHGFTFRFPFLPTGRFFTHGILRRLCWKNDHFSVSLQVSLQPTFFALSFCFLRGLHYKFCHWNVLHWIAQPVLFSNQFASSLLIPLGFKFHYSLSVRDFFLLFSGRFAPLLLLSFQAPLDPSLFSVFWNTEPAFFFSSAACHGDVPVVPGASPSLVVSRSPPVCFSSRRLVVFGAFFVLFGKHRNEWIPHNQRYFSFLFKHAPNSNVNLFFPLRWIDTASSMII